MTDPATLDFETLLDRIRARGEGADLNTPSDDWRCRHRECRRPGWIPETDEEGNERLRPCPDHKPNAHRAFMDGPEAMSAYWNRVDKKKSEAEEKQDRKREWA